MNTTQHSNHHTSVNSRGKTGKSIWGSIGSILIAIVASSHHWLHMLLIALGVGVLGEGILNMPTPIRIGLIVISVIVSVWMLFAAWRKRANNKAVAWVYFISSVISLVIIATSFPKFVQAPVSPANSIHQADSHQDMQ